MPQIWNNTLTVTVHELVPTFYNSEGALKLEISRYQDKNYGIKKVQRGGNGRLMLIAFDSLPADVQQALGDPRKINNPLEAFYKTDPDAVRYYTKEYRFDDGDCLKLAQQEEYINNAGVLVAAIELKEKRENMWRSLGRKSTKGIMASILDDVIKFNKVLKIKHNATHTLPASEKRFKETFNEFLKGCPNPVKEGETYLYNYQSLISGRLKNENRKRVTDDLLCLLNDLFATQVHKPSPTDITRQYEAFLSGYLDVLKDDDTGELWNPKDFKAISASTITNYLARWESRVASHKKRSHDRQKYNGQYRPYHSFNRPTLAGSLLSIDDREPPFEYAKGKRVCFYMAVDVASGAIICYVHGTSKEDMITRFYQELIKVHVAKGYMLPLELECESHLNAGFKNTFLRPGAMFDHVRIEANNARGKWIERVNGKLRYSEDEKGQKGWKARPHARRESNQKNEQEDVPCIPYEDIVQIALRSMQNHNNEPHDIHKNKTRWQVYEDMQNPGLHEINWNAILPHLGNISKTTCRDNGSIHLCGKEFLPGIDGEVATGNKLIRCMKRIAGKSITVYWLQGMDNEVMKAHVYLNEEMICEAVPKPVYQRAIVERTQEDKKKEEIMSRFIATIDGFTKEKMTERTRVALTDNRPELPKTFVFPELEAMARKTPDVPEEQKILGTMEDAEDEMETETTFIKPYKDRF